MGVHMGVGIVGIATAVTGDMLPAKYKVARHIII